MDQIKKTSGAIPLWITRIAPFLLPAVFFQSAVFAFISPLPLFLLSLKRNPLLIFGALLTNIALVYFTGVREEALVVAVFWFAIGIFFPLLIKRSGKIQLSYLISLAYLLSMAMIGVYYLAHQAGMGVIEYVRFELNVGMNQLLAMPNSPFKDLVEEQGRPGLFKELMTQLPSGMVMALMIALWVNLLFASQLVQEFMPKDFWAEFRVPEYIVWPTLICAGLFIGTDHALYYIGLNGLKILLVFYGFQGLSVMSSLLTQYKIVGIGRGIIFTLAIFIAMPFVLSLGFFDLWFDFRRKFGQS